MRVPAIAAALGHDRSYRVEERGRVVLGSAVLAKADFLLQARVGRSTGKLGGVDSVAVLDAVEILFGGRESDDWWHGVESGDDEDSD